MATYIIRRLIHTIVILILVSFFCFSLIHMTPGDPVRAMLGPLALEEEVAFARAELGLDKPFFIQYGNWVANVLHGDFGKSLRYKVPVVELFIERFPTTAYLAFLALILSVVLGIPTGIISAVRRATFLDQVLVALATTGISIPLFWLGMLGIYLFGLHLGWLPIQGWVMPTVDFQKSIGHTIMPAILLAVPSIAILARQTRSSMLETIRLDYVRTAKAKGLAERVVVLKHALKNALIPIATLIGLEVRILLGGSVLIETVFNIPGMGRLLVDAAFNKDYFVLQGGVLILGALVCLVNLLVDISYGYLDPRIRYE